MVTLFFELIHVKWSLLFWTNSSTRGSIWRVPVRESMDVAGSISNMLSGCWYLIGSAQWPSNPYASHSMLYRRVNEVHSRTKSCSTYEIVEWVDLERLAPVLRSVLTVHTILVPITCIVDQSWVIWLHYAPLNPSNRMCFYTTLGIPMVWFRWTYVRVVGYSVPTF